MKHLMVSCCMSVSHNNTSSAINGYWLCFIVQVSQSLSGVFEQFQQLLSNPVRCTNQMAQVASLFGGRRICKLAIQLTDQNLLGRPCMVYCLEQETITDALQMIRPMVRCFFLFFLFFTTFLFSVASIELSLGSLLEESLL